MNRIEYGIVTGCLAAAIVFSPAGSPAAADPKARPEHRIGQLRAKSSPPADAPLLGRVVVTPTPEQAAKIRLERCMTELENRAIASQKAAHGYREAADAL